MNVAFAHVYDEYFIKIYNYVYYRLLNRHDAEDVVSEVFYKALENYARFEGRSGAAVSTWLFAIAKNAVNDHYRKSKKAAFVDFAEQEQNLVADDEFEAWENGQRLRDALITLDERSREALALRYWGDMSCAEIAVKLGMSESNTGAILSRAKAKLRVLFESEMT